MSRSKDVAGTSRAFSALLLGFLAAALVVAGFLKGLDRRAELQFLDFRFRHVSSAPANGDIVHVDIDDNSLAEIGRWPWPRENLAGIISVLDECGAKTIAVDILLPEPQKIRYVSEAADISNSPLAGIDADRTPTAVIDDGVLAETLAAKKNVFLSVHAELDPAGSETGDDFAKIAELVAADPAVSLETVLKKVLPDADPSAHTPRQDAVEQAYMQCRAEVAMKRLAVHVATSVCPPVREGRIIPPFVIFAERVEHCGFVTFQPDVDGVLRRVPLLVGSNGACYPQLGLAVAADELGGKIDGAFGAVKLAGRDIVTDSDKTMLINWQSPENSPKHVSVSLPYAVWRQRQCIKKNQDTAVRMYLELGQEFGVMEMFDLASAWAEAHKALAAAETQWYRATLAAPADAPAAYEALKKQRQAAAEADRKILSAGREMLKKFDEHLANIEADRREEFVAFRKKLDDIENSFAPLRKNADEMMEKLRSLVAGRICLVGSTATGAADFVVTPMGERVPGVQVHANVLNTILSGSFVHKPPLWVSLAVIIAAGAAVSFVTAYRPVWQAGPAAILLAGGYVAANFLIFAKSSYWVILVAPLAAMAASFVLVTAYRQLTEERAKRRIKSLFANALSPALVDRLIADPSMARLGGEKRVLTCYFSDLAGFTATAERLGEQRTVRLLNRYFDRMSEIIQDNHGGYLNKFLGDGIFVFFGAPVLQDDHAARAVAAAVAAQTEVDKLNETLGDEFFGVRIACRIGMATGEVMVGNCGSSTRMDYTAIGDCVNLASRLESANKFFGTRILAAESTWLACGSGEREKLLVRPLGRIRVVGKTEAVGIFDILGRRDELTADMPDAAEKCENFARGVELFRAGRFSEAAAIFEQSAIGDDAAAKVLIGLSGGYAASPPAGWDGVIELTEK